jgi:hypothetical protein
MANSIRKVFLLVILLWATSVHAFPGIMGGHAGTGGSGGGNNGFTAVKTITIDHNQVGSSDLTNFPFLFSGTYAYLKTTGNGGDVTNANGYDIVFYPNPDCTGTKLDHEIDSYSATTGAVNFWARVATISHTADTTFYLCYGKSIITTSQENKSAVWDSNYLAVYHFGNGASLSLADSTAGGYTFTNSNTTASTGQIGGAASFNASNKFIKNTSFPPPTSITLAWWQNAPAQSDKGVYSLIVGDRADTPNRVLTHAPYIDHVLYWDFGWSGNGGRVSTNYTSYESAWTYVVLTYNNANGEHKIFLNGTQVQTSTNTNSNTLGNGLYVAHCDATNCAGSGWWAAEFDELQISNSARSADWILAEYNNQKNPGAFYTVTGGTP